MYQDLTPWPYAGDPALPYIADGLKIPKYPDVRSGYRDDNIDWGDESGLLRALTCTWKRRRHVRAELRRGQGAADRRVRQRRSCCKFKDSRRAPRQGGDPPAGSRPTSSNRHQQRALDHPQPSDRRRDHEMALGHVQRGACRRQGDVHRRPRVGHRVRRAQLGGRNGRPGLPVASVDRWTRVTAPAQDLAEKLVRQQVASETWINTMETILVDDYGKLTAVGDGIGTGGEWTWTDDVTNGSILKALSGSTRAAAYTALVPAAWAGTTSRPASARHPGPRPTSTSPATSRRTTPGTTTRSPPRTRRTCSTWRRSWGAAAGCRTSSGMLAQLVDFPWTPNRDAYAPMPSGSVTDFIYGAHSTGDSGAFAYAPAWWRSTFDLPYVLRARLRRTSGRRGLVAALRAAGHRAAVALTGVLVRPSARRRQPAGTDGGGVGVTAAAAASRSLNHSSPSIESSAWPCRASAASTSGAAEQGHDRGHEQAADDRGVDRHRRRHPDAELLDVRVAVEEEGAEHRTMISAAEVITRPVVARPVDHRLVRVVGLLVGLAHVAHEEDLVVHREPEQDREHHQRHEARRSARSSSSPTSVADRSWLEHEGHDAERGARSRAGS